MPCIAFIGDTADHNLYYLGAGELVPEVIGSTGSIDHSEANFDLALKRNGTPGIAYVDDRVGDLIYAERQASGWVSETVDAVSQVGYFPSLAYDSPGVPYISYFDNTNNDIKYATRIEGGWHIETIDASGEPGFHIPAGFTSLALSTETGAYGPETQTVHVAYLSYRYKPYDGQLRYATRHTQGWEIETVDATRGAGGFPSLTMDHAGHPWISYYRAGTWDYHTGELRLAHYDGNRWRIEVLDAKGNAGRFNALALTPDDRPIIAYYASTPADLRVVWWDERWHQTTLFSEGDVGAWVNLALDAQDRAHVVYVDATQRAARYAIAEIPSP